MPTGTGIAGRPVRWQIGELTEGSSKARIQGAPAEKAVLLARFAYWMLRRKLGRAVSLDGGDVDRRDELSSLRWDADMTDSQVAPSWS